MLALSNDGRTLVYIGLRAGVQTLFSRHLDQLETLEIAEGIGVSDLFFSHDDEWLAFERGGDGLQKLYLQGGGPVTLTTYGVLRGGDWGEDGFLIWGNLGGGLHRVSEDGGESEALTTPQPPEAHELPHVLPGGRKVLFTRISGAELMIAILDLEDGTTRPLLPGIGARYAHSGHLVFADDNRLWAAPFDLEAGDTTGPPVPVVDNIASTQPYYPQFDVSSDGTLVYLTGTLSSENIVLTWVNHDGSEESTDLPANSTSLLALSPDERRVAIAINSDQGVDIWLYDLLEQTSPRQLTFASKVNMNPTWTPDGQRITYWSADAGSGDPGASAGSFWTINTDGTGQPQRLAAANTPGRGAWSPDGERFVYVTVESANDLDLWSFSTATGTSEPLLATLAWEYQPVVSPDGRWLAYVSNETGDYGDVFVRPFPDVESAIWRLSTNGGHSPMWSRDGRQLFFQTDDSMNAVSVMAGPTFTTGRQERLFDTTAYWQGPNPASRTMYDVDSGGRFLMVRSSAGDGGATERIVLVQNWFEELKRLVPTD